MNQSASQTFQDKVNLIYEYNRQSPLFVRVANGELEKNNTERAVEILKDGLELFPDYPVAHVLMGKALMLLGKYKESLDSYRRAGEIVNSHHLYEHYLLEVENLKKQRILFETSRKPGFLDETGEGDRKENKISLENELSSFDSMSSNKIQQAKTGQGSDSIVSETLANIYITQGEFREALSIFERLLIKNPQKSEYYRQKINELKARLD
ncbi:MAG TPA: tetratricopeptide repeat protein [Ignavibacteriaceae bacterium]